MVFDVLGVVAAVVGVVAFVVAWLAMRGADLNGHKWIAWLGLVGVYTTTLLSVLYVFTLVTSPLFVWLRGLSRINRIFTPLVLAAFIVYLGPRRVDLARDRRDWWRGGSGSGGSVGDSEGPEGVGGSVGHQRKVVA